MNKFLIPLLLSLVLVFSSGCATSAQKRQYESAQRGVYAVQKALSVGRVDLAKKYADEVVKVVPPPKKKHQIVIKPIEITKPSSNPGIVSSEKVRLTILPAEYNNQPTMVTGSPEMNKLVSEQPLIAKQLEQEAKEFDKYQEKVEDAQRAVQKEVEKPKKTFLSKVTSFFGLSSLFAIVVVGGGLALLAITNPALIPKIVFSIVNFFVKIISGFAGGLVNLFKPKS